MLRWLVLLLVFGCDPCRCVAGDVLYVFEASWCTPCKSFERAWDTDAEFRNTLRQHFDVRSVSLDKPAQAAFAKTMGVHKVPTFQVVRANGRREEPVIGYTTQQDLLMRLGLDNLPAPLPPDPDPPRTKPQQVPQPQVSADEWKRRVGEELAQINSDINKVTTEHRALRDQLQQSAAELQAIKDAANKPQPAAPNTTATIDEIFGPTDKPPPDKPGQPDVPLSLPVPQIDSGSGLGALLMHVAGRVAATALTAEVGVPLAAGGAVLSALGWMWSRSRARRQRTQEPMAVQQPRPSAITIDSPPLPQAIVPETRYAAYETDTFAEAFAWAEQQMARKYPGAVGTLETIRGLIDQYLSAKGIKRTAAK